MLTLRIFSYQESLKTQTKIDDYFIRLPHNSATHADSLTDSAVTGLVGGDGKGKAEDRKGKGRQNFPCEGRLNAAEREGSETADEEEGSFRIFQPGVHRYPHPEDSQDLNLYPSQYDHSSGFSQVYGNLLL